MKRPIIRGEAGINQVISDLQRRFQYPFEEAPVSAPILGGGGGMAHILIVSESEPDTVQRKADFVVPASNSGASLQTIFDGLQSGPITIWLAGQFDLEIDVVAPSGAWVRGLGYSTSGGEE